MRLRTAIRFASFVSAALVALSAASLADGAVTIGSDLTTDAPRGVVQCLSTPCTVSQRAVPTSSQAPGGLTAPTDGVAGPLATRSREPDPRQPHCESSVRVPSRSMISSPSAPGSRPSSPQQMNSRPSRCGFRFRRGQARQSTAVPQHTSTLSPSRRMPRSITRHRSLLDGSDAFCRERRVHRARSTSERRHPSPTWMRTGSATKHSISARATRQPRSLVRREPMMTRLDGDHQGSPEEVETGEGEVQASRPTIPPPRSSAR